MDQSKKALMKIWKTLGFFFFRKSNKKKKDLKKTASFEKNSKDVENIKTDQSKIFHGFFFILSVFIFLFQVNEIDQNSRCRICLDLGLFRKKHSQC